MFILMRLIFGRSPTDRVLCTKVVGATSSDDLSSRNCFLSCSCAQPGEPCTGDEVVGSRRRGSVCAGRSSTIDRRVQSAAIHVTLDETFYLHHLASLPLTSLDRYRPAVPQV